MMLNFTDIEGNSWTIKRHTIDGYCFINDYTHVKSRGAISAIVQHVGNATQIFFKNKTIIVEGDLRAELDQTR